MKDITKILLLTLILLLSFNTTSLAQVEDHYHWISCNFYIPIIVDHQEVWESHTGDITEKNIPDKPVSINFGFKAEDMNMQDNVFSGVVVNDNYALKEVITYQGKVSEDKQSLEYIEVTKNATQYITDKREVVEKITEVQAKFEDVPIKFGGYKFKYEVTNITSVHFYEEYSIPRYGRTESYTESFVKINEEKITKYTSNCVSVSFKPGVLYPEEMSYITIEGPDSVRLEGVAEDPEGDVFIELTAESELEGDFLWETDCENIKLIPNGNDDKKVTVQVFNRPSWGNNAWVKAVQKIGATEVSAVHKIDINGSLYDGKKTVRVMVSNENNHLMKGIGALIISDLMKNPDVALFEGMKIDKLKAEIALSQSGLVSPETWIPPDRMIKHVNLEIIIHEVNILREDQESPPEKITIKVLYKYQGNSKKKTFIWLYGASTPFFDIISEISSKALEILDL